MANESSGTQRALSLLQQGRLAECERVCLQQTRFQPEDVDAWFLLGVARHMAGNLGGADEALDRTLALAPAHLQARNARATVLMQAERPEKALTVCLEGLSIYPAAVQLLVNTAIVCEQLGRMGEAEGFYRRALVHEPASQSALLNLGVLQLRTGNPEAALTCFASLAAIAPALADAHFNTAEASLVLGRYEEAVRACDAALALEPAHAKAHFDRGLALSMLRRFAEATTALSTAQLHDPDVIKRYLDAIDLPPEIKQDYLDPRVIYLHRGYDRLKVCDWREAENYSRTLAALVLNRAHALPLHNRSLVFYSFSADVGPEVQLKLARDISDFVADKIWISGHQPFAHQRVANPRLRIGYVSPDFRNHPTAYLTRRLFALHDRAQFEVFAYSLHPGSGEEIRSEIERSCDRFTEVSAMSDAEIARLIHDDEVDVLVDLAGYTTHSRSEIFAYRPAPVQVNYLGFPGTTGADFMDYAIVDRTICPEGHEAYWSEQPVFMPETYFIYNNRQKTAPPLSRTEYGLPEDGVVFCCFNNNFKIDRTIFERWMRLLQQVPGSVLWLLNPHPDIKTNLAHEARSCGIDPARLVFAPLLPHEQHLARYHVADIFLDTLHYNAHTTAADALWAGTPVVTKPGETFASRVAASLCRAAGMAETVCESLDAYETLALKLATDPAMLASFRDRLRQNRLSSPLFDTEGTVKNLEEAYRAVWARHLNKLPRAPLEVAR